VSAESGLASADYLKAARHCDVVMKGGITSGVVYPLAVCELAQDYKFKCVGGTSAGAIAAAATAAAEYGRARRGAGFGRLARLPEELGKAERLRSLFQPERSTRPLFNVLIGSLGGGRWGAVRAVLLGNFFTALVGAVAGLALLVLFFLHGTSDGFDLLTVLGCVAGAVFALLGATAAVLLRLGRVLLRKVPDNSFGMCSGNRPDSSERPGLTPWLSGLLNECAGLGSGDPLTFGDLWAGPEPAEGVGPRNPPPPGKRFVELQMMTTNLVNHVAATIPWGEGAKGGWYFDPVEFRKLFPEEVVRWMEAHPPPPKPGRAGQKSEIHRALMLPRLPLPEAKDLPVVVATRMSLSFPVLLSAVPLWAFDFGRPAVQKAQDEWNAWLNEKPSSWRVPCGSPDDWPFTGLPAPLEPEPCWFSDGGISSNFPIHFFDRLVPGRPTFGIDLRPFPPEEKPDPEDQTKNVEMPTDNSQGHMNSWYRLPRRKRRALIADGRLPAFLMAAVATM
jgi:predicted acylesterase/phospholipase RssA